jgi:hypothetical protein
VAEEWDRDQQDGEQGDEETLAQDAGAGGRSRPEAAEQQDDAGGEDDGGQVGDVQQEGVPGLFVEPELPTPGSAAMAERRGWMYPAAAPAVIATPRSSRPGNVRPRISCGSARTSMTLPPAMRLIAHPTTIARIVPAAMIKSARARRRLSAVTTAAEAPMIGVINGATSMAPITTAPESARSPNAAIDELNAIRERNRKK